MHEDQTRPSDDNSVQFIIGSLERSIEDLTLTLAEAAFVRRESGTTRNTGILREPSPIHERDLSLRH